MADRTRILPYDPEYREQVLALQASLWTPDVDLASRYFAWKYENNPFGAGPPAYLALTADGSVVGMRGFFGMSWSVGEASVHLPAACDFAILEPFRNQGIASRIMEVATQGFAQQGTRALVNLSAGNPVTHLMALSSGWRVATPIQPLSHAHGGLVGRGVRKARSAMGVKSREVYGHLDGARTAGTGLTIGSAAVPDAMASAASRSLPVDGKLRHVRDTTYLDWRFQNPLTEFRFILAGVDPCDGYVVLAADRRAEGGGVMLADHVAVDHDTLVDLMRATLELGRFSMTRMWGGSLEPKVHAALLEMGFTEPEGKPSLASPSRSLLVRDLGPDPSWRIGDTSLCGVENWDIRAIFSDGV